MGERGKGKNKKESKVWLDNYWSDKCMKVHLYFPYSCVFEKVYKSHEKYPKSMQIKI